MSPPSLATAGRTRVSISSLMVATVSESFGSKNSRASSAAAPVSPRTSGAPDMKCSMMAPRIRLELLPFAARPGDGDEIGAKEDAGDAFDPEQALGERRLRGGGLVAHVERAG